LYGELPPQRVLCSKKNGPPQEHLCCFVDLILLVQWHGYHHSRFDCTVHMVRTTTKIVICSMMHVRERTCLLLWTQRKYHYNQHPRCYATDYPPATPFAPIRYGYPNSSSHLLCRRPCNQSHLINQAIDRRERKQSVSRCQSRKRAARFEATRSH